MTTIVFAAHADDEVIGCGGTIAKLSKKEKVIVVIFSDSSGSAGNLTSWPPFMSENNLRKRRRYESEKAGRILGVHKNIFLGIKSNLEEEISMEHKEKIIDIIKENKPDKIFYHSSKDVHPDHHAVFEVMEGIVSDLKNKPEVFTFQINLFDFSSGNPKIIFDVSEEFNLKIRAMLNFKSQIISILPLSPLVLLKGRIFGKKHGFKFAEYFYGR